MKFLVLQENGEHQANRHFRECFSVQRALTTLGYSCDVWGLNQIGWPQYPDFDSYDIIIILENYDKGWLSEICSKLRQSKAFKVLWSIDAHCKGIEYYQNLFVASGSRFCLQATLDFVDAIPNSSWFPNCFDDTLIKPLDIPKTVPLGFCGNYVNRKGWIDYLDQNIEGGIKKDIFVIGDAMVEAINSYQIGFNKNMAQDLNYRNFETIGCRTLLLTDYNWQYKKLGFIHNENAVFYNTPVDLLIKIKELLKNPLELDRIAANGYLLSKKHTYLCRMRSLVDFLNKNKQIN